jgi:hypothetical protein
MAYKACEDCGTRLSDGYCPNCHEELAIFEQDPGGEFSQEFMDQVTEQDHQRWERLKHEREREVEKQKMQEMRSSV